MGPHFFCGSTWVGTGYFVLDGDVDYSLKPKKWTTLMYAYVYSVNPMAYTTYLDEKSWHVVRETRGDSLLRSLAEGYTLSLDILKFLVKRVLSSQSAHKALICHKDEWHENSRTVGWRIHLRLARGRFYLHCTTYFTVEGRWCRQLFDKTDESLTEMFKHE